MHHTWLVIDSNYLCRRAEYTMGPLSHGGNLTGISYGFLRDILDMKEQFQAYSVVFCWDSKHSKRKEMYPQYKAKRKNQKPMSDEDFQLELDFRRQIKLLRKKYLPMIGYKNVFQQKGYEGDDLIASVVRNLPEKDEAIIVSSDQDLFQLISYNVSIYNPQSRKQVTLQLFKKEYGIPPTSWDLVKAYAGCSTDNVEGIAGIGEKTAILILKGLVPYKNKTYKIATSTAGQTIVARNLSLVHLPLRGTKIYNLQEDQLSQDGWTKVCKKLGIKSLRNKLSVGRR